MAINPPPAPNGPDPMPRAPVSSGVLAARRAQEEAERAYEDFAKLPILEHLQEVWEAKGVTRNDPVWLLVETLAIFDNRLKERNERFLEVARRNAELCTKTMEEARRILEQGVALEKTIATSTATQTEVLGRMKQSGALMQQFCDAMPKLVDNLYTSMKLIDQKGLLSGLLNYGVVFVSLIGGLALGYFLFRPTP